MTRRVLIVIPTYDERESLPALVRGIREVLPDAHVLVVDDASPDGTGEIADDLARQDPRLRVLHRPTKQGLASAYLEAFHRALASTPAYDVVVEMDADLSHDPRHLPALMEAIDGGADVVLGSRGVPGGGIEGWGFTRHVLSKGGSLYSRLLLGLDIRDLTTGYKAFRRSVLEALDLKRVRSEGYAFQIELTYRAIRRGFRVEEVPIVFTDRRAGASKMSARVFLEAVLLVPWLRVQALLGRLDDAG